ncbi:MAG: hypothetical protein HY543_03375 [Deltaproteobacteria bacterium]|nr:hypothetical protein [Deltaproteobacteria bacterium]
MLWKYIRAGMIGGLRGLGLGFLIGASVAALIHIVVGVLLHGAPITTIPDSAPLRFQFTFSWGAVVWASLFWGGLFGSINIFSGIIVGCLRLHRRQQLK